MDDRYPYMLSALTLHSPLGGPTLIAAECDTGGKPPSESYRPTKPDGGDGGGGVEPPAPLDHTLYPHIMDDVLRFAPAEALLKLRCTSRQFRSRVDGVFAAHVVIADARDMHLTPSSTSSFLDVTPHMAPKVRPPLDLRRTRVVDLVGPVGARPVSYRCSGGRTGHELYLEYLASRLVHADVVRLRPDAEGRAVTCCPVKAPSVVAFTQFSEPDSGCPSTAAVGPIPDSVERLVLNVAYEPRSWWLPHASLSVGDLAHHHPNLEHIVVILSPRASSHGCTRAYGETLGPAQWMGMMSSIVNLICYTLPRVQYTLVGVDKLEPEWLGIEPDWHGSSPSSIGSSMFDFRPETSENLVLDALAIELKRRHGWDMDEVDAALQRIAFVTRTAYEKTRTPREFELETWQQ